MFRRSLGTYAFYLLPLVLTACGDKTLPDPRTQIPLVKTAAVTQASATEQMFTGVVAARVQSDLSFRVSGKVLQRLVDTGQSVKRGQLLMRIDPNDLGLEQHAQAEAVAAAQAQARQAIDDELRYRDLVQAGAVSASAYGQIKAAADSARAQLSAAQARSGVAQNAASYAELVADSDGVVVETLAEPGQVVGAGQIVVRLAHAGPREAVIQLPETVRPALGSSAQAALYGHDNPDASARLRQLSDAADRMTRTYEARYVLNGALADAPLGATVTLHLAQPRSSRQDAWRVPMGAIFDSGKDTGVWLLKDKNAQVSWRSVHVVDISDDSASVTGDLHSGDQIVALGAQLLHEGEQVRVGGADAAAAVTRGGQQ